MNGVGSTRRIAPLVATAALSVAAGSDLEERLVKCSEEHNDAARLACYDREAAQIARVTPNAASTPEAASTREPARAANSTPAPRSPPASKADTPVTGTSPEDDFGVAGSEVARRRGAENRKGAGADLDRLIATVTAVSNRPRGELVVKLDNGQVWMQKNPRYLPIKAGDRVTILKGALGSYSLAIDGRSTQVTRIE